MGIYLVSGNMPVVKMGIYRALGLMPVVKMGIYGVLCLILVVGYLFKSLKINQIGKNY